MSQNKKVAIILINYKDYAQRFLLDCIRGLKSQNYPSNQYKIFIVDNETSEQSQTYLRETASEAQFIFNKKNAGFARGNNDAIKLALDQSFAYIVLLNMDTIVDRNWLSQLVRVAESNDNYGIIQSRIMLWSGDKKENKINSLGNNLHFLGFGYCQGYQKDWRGQVKKPREITYASGAAVLIKCGVFKKIGLLAEEFFMYHEDTDLSWRARLVGYQIVLAPDSVVWHKYEFERSVRQFYFIERNRLTMMLENYRWPTLVLLLPAFIFMEAGLLAYSFLTGLWREKLKVYWYFWQSKNLKMIIKNHQQKSRQRAVGDRAIAKYLTGKIQFQEIENPLLKYVANPILNFYWLIVRNLIFW